MPAGAELAKHQPALSLLRESHAVSATLNNHDTSTRRTTTGAAMPAGVKLARRQPHSAYGAKSHAALVE